MWIFFLILIVPGFITFALGFIFRLFWLLTILLMLIVVAVAGSEAYLRGSCLLGDPQSCLMVNYAHFELEGMTAEQLRRREDDYNRFPAADRNQSVRRWSLLRWERLDGVVYQTRQDCFGPLWPEVGSFLNYQAFQMQCFDRRIISPGSRLGEDLPPVEEYVDYPDDGSGPYRIYSHGGKVLMNDVRAKWAGAIGMFDRSQAGEEPTS